MTEKKSTKATILGVGTSLASLLGVCGTTCGVVCAAPIASIFGISTAGLSAFTSTFLPVLTAISAVAFTIAYFSLYKKNESTCRPEDCTESKKQKTRWAKPMFWIGLLLTLGFYTNAVINSSKRNISCEQSTSCEAEDTKKSCNPSDCLIEKK